MLGPEREGQRESEAAQRTSASINRTRPSASQKLSTWVPVQGYSSIHEHLAPGLFLCLSNPLFFFFLNEHFKPSGSVRLFSKKRNTIRLKSSWVQLGAVWSERRQRRGKQRRRGRAKRWRWPSASPTADDVVSQGDLRTSGRVSLSGQLLGQEPGQVESSSRRLHRCSTAQEGFRDPSGGW